MSKEDLIFIVIGPMYSPDGNVMRGSVNVTNGGNSPECTFSFAFFLARFRAASVASTLSNGDASSPEHASTVASVRSFIRSDKNGYELFRNAMYEPATNLHKPISRCFKTANSVPSMVSSASSAQGEPLGNSTVTVRLKTMSHCAGNAIAMGSGAHVVWIAPICSNCVRSLRRFKTHAHKDIRIAAAICA